MEWNNDQTDIILHSESIIFDEIFIVKICIHVLPSARYNLEFIISFCHADLRHGVTILETLPDDLQSRFIRWYLNLVYISR